MNYCRCSLFWPFACRNLFHVSIFRCRVCEPFDCTLFSVNSLFVDFSQFNSYQSFGCAVIQTLFRCVHHIQTNDFECEWNSHVAPKTIHSPINSPLRARQVSISSDRTLELHVGQSSYGDFLRHFEQKSVSISNCMRRVFSPHVFVMIVLPCVNVVAAILCQ